MPWLGTPPLLYVDFLPPLCLLTLFFASSTSLLTIVALLKLCAIVRICISLECRNTPDPISVSCPLSFSSFGLCLLIWSHSLSLFSQSHWQAMRTVWYFRSMCVLLLHLQARPQVEMRKTDCVGIWIYTKCSSIRLSLTYITDLCNGIQHSRRWPHLHYLCFSVSDAIKVYIYF